MTDALVIIPTYNEKENIVKIIDAVMHQEYPFDILIIDDGSPDGTAQIVEGLLPKYNGRLHLEKRTGKLGLGTAYIHGFKCYTREVLETIHANRIHFVGYAFQIEMKFKTWKYGFKIKEVPVIFTDRKEGTSKMSSGIFKEAIFGVIKLKVLSYFVKWDRGDKESA